MSQSLRERIEGLQLGVSWGPAEEEHDLIDKADVLRIIAEHEREQAAVAIGVRPVAQLSEKIGELPDAVPPRDDIEAAKIRIAELEEQMRALGDDRTVPCSLPRSMESGRARGRKAGIGG